MLLTTRDRLFVCRQCSLLLWKWTWVAFCTTIRDMSHSTVQFHTASSPPLCRCSDHEADGCFGTSCVRTYRYVEASFCSGSHSSQRLLCTTFVCALQVFAAYITDWAHYRPAPYTYVRLSVRLSLCRLASSCAKQTRVDWMGCYPSDVPAYSCRCRRRRRRRRRCCCCCRDTRVCVQQRIHANVRSAVGGRLRTTPRSPNGRTWRCTRSFTSAHRQEPGLFVCLW